jgi:NAD(P)-dependent dehydrogenase (short-subunit alcohol dehydrogenase family)
MVQNLEHDTRKTWAAPLADVAGKSAFITGGSSGVGLGIARACAEAGMNVVITYRTPGHLKDALRHFDASSRLHAIRVDATDRRGMKSAAAEAERVFGNIHLLCNNAGVGIRTLITNATFDDWDFGIAVNVGGVINGLQIILPRMIAHGEPAHVVSTSSMSGLFHGGAVGIYTATKFAVVGIMEALRAELRERGIGASVLCPGLVTSRIYDSDRNRPARPAALRTQADADREETYRALMASGMDPLECGRKVLRGIRRNELYILTHPEFERGIRDRWEVLKASIRQHDDHAPPSSRLAAERATLRHEIYIDEKRRLRARDGK